MLLKNFHPRLRPAATSSSLLRSISSIADPAAASPQDDASKKKSVLEDRIRQLSGWRFTPDNCSFDSRSPKMLWEALNDHMPSYRMKSELPPGFHQVCCPSNDPEALLFDDGATSKHAPGKEWVFRVWAGGRMLFDHAPEDTALARSVKVREQITDIQFKGDMSTDDGKVLVTIRKQLSWENPQHRALRHQRYRQQQQQQQQAPPQPESSGQKDPSAVESITEERVLCFMRSIPAGLSSPDQQRKVKPPTDPYYTQSMVPSATLLFRFSALTMNAHKIHFDPDYTRTVYGVPRLVVQGPLTSVLLMAVLREALAKRGDELSCRYQIRSISYKNIAPLFVDEHMAICCKRVRPGEDGQGQKQSAAAGAEETSEDWKVWIQKGEGADASLAVLGTVTATVERCSADTMAHFRLAREKEHKFLTAMGRRRGIITTREPGGESPKHEISEDMLSLDHPWRRLQQITSDQQK